MEILIIAATEKPSSFPGVAVFDGITVGGEKCLILKTNDPGLPELAAGAPAEEWRPLWQRP